MMEVPVYILAGGKSSRFGSDKARAMLRGVPLVVRLGRMAEAVLGAGAAHRVTVVADVAGKYEDLGLRTIADLRPGLGPLGGLEAALADGWGGSSARDPAGPSGEWMLLLSCDQVVLRPAWVRMLLAQVREDVEVVVFQGDRWQPVPGLYRASLKRTVGEQIDRGELAMWKLIERSRHVALPLPADWPAVAQANTLAELARAGAVLDEEQAKGCR